jgi:FkbM family methyltransferase
MGADMGEAVIEAARRPETVGHFRTPGGRPADMVIREGTNDWNTLNACMTEDEYHLRDWRGSGWAFDIGGYLGGVGIGLALDNPELSVLIVEPVPDNARLIRANIGMNDCADRVTLIENAVTGPQRAPVKVWHSYSGTPSLEHHAFVGNSTLAYDHGGEMPHEETVYDQPETLWTMLNRTASPRVGLLKIDCEGGEWDILAAGQAVALFDLIVGEAHSVRGHRGSDIVGLLDATHEVFLEGDPDATCEFRAVAR